MLMYPKWNEPPKKRWRKSGIRVQLVEELNGVAIGEVFSIPVSLPREGKPLSGIVDYEKNKRDWRNNMRKSWPDMFGTDYE